MAEPAEEVPLAELTTQIVSAYISHNQIGSADLAGLIAAVAGQLGRIGSEPEQPVETKPAPAVPVRRSIKPDHLICLICGKKQKVLKRHLAVAHGLDPDQYRRPFDLPRDYPMAAPDYTQRRRELALQIGLGQSQKPPRKGRKAGARSQTPQQPEEGQSAQSGDALELLEPGGKPGPVRAVLLSPGQPDLCARDSFEALLEERAVVEHQQPLGDVHPAVGIDADQVAVEGGVVDLRKGDAVGEYGLAEKLVGVGHDVGGIEQVWNETVTH